MRLLIGMLAIAMYSGITFYLGWNLKKWLLALSIFRFEPLYWIVVFGVSFSFILGRLHEWLKPLGVVGNYWMFVLQYGLLICIVINLVIWLTVLYGLVR